jgi:hypothetical protein
LGGVYSLDYARFLMDDYRPRGYYYARTTKMQVVFDGGKSLLQVDILWYTLFFKNNVDK